MKLLLFLAIIFTLSSCTTKIKVNKEKSDDRSSFSEVWKQVESDPLAKLPHGSVSYFKLFTFKEDIILQDAHRTLNDHADILPAFEKLAHPNGICFRGIWEIEKENIYSGYFKQNSKALIIARASTATSDTLRGSNRAFGFAGKLFASTDANEVNNENSANFFLIDDLGGTDAKHYKDVAMSNEPNVSMNFSMVKNLLYALKVSSAFKEADTNPGIRQLYEISQLGEKASKNIVTPKWMKIEAADDKRVDAKDFRDELKIQKNEKLVFNIFVANKMTGTNKGWQNIGTITLYKSIVSASCDQRLHFHHPKWRWDLNYGDK
ncbi:hypothetical protein [Sulfurimonas sp.]|uniref:hypothetical protein n=1 Tax=Sulfurimonas sp. TaxID=2022749 RepID=UPI002B49EDEB|nr:hypothetical protein [Sulfurimonas sp.]